MDAFWKKVQSDTLKYLDELRSELKMEGNPKFFYFEGGQLLLSLSRNMKDKETVLNAIRKSDLNDIDRRTYVSTLNYLARSNLNTTEAALRIVDDSDYEFFIPEHSFNFNQTYCLIYALLPTKADFYVKTVIERFKADKSVPVKMAIITLLWVANSCEGNDFLKGLLADKAVGKEVVDYANDILTSKLKKEKYYEALDDMNFEDLVKAQVASTNRMSDEAIYELFYITKVVRKNNCR